MTHSLINRKKLLHHSTNSKCQNSVALKNMYAMVRHSVEAIIGGGGGWGVVV